MKYVVTNLRIPEADYLAIKALAAEERFSVNQYLNKLVTEGSSRAAIVESQPITKKTKKSIWDLSQLAKKPNKLEFDGLSTEDEVIYG